MLGRKKNRRPAINFNPMAARKPSRKKKVLKAGLVGTAVTVGVSALSKRRNSGT